MTWKDNKQFATVNGHRMAYVEMGQGPTMLFLHGNPTSSYLWRNIMTPLSDGYRCIAPDLIGMGDSDKLPDSGPERYTFAEHYRYLAALIDQLVPDGPVILVIHDWGSALGFHWANTHRHRVAGIAYMESIVHPYSWERFPKPPDRCSRAFAPPPAK